MGRLDNIDSTPLLTSKELSCQEDHLDFENQKYVVSYWGQGPAFSLDCPATDILKFLSTGNELKLLTPAGGWGWGESSILKPSQL